MLRYVSVKRQLSLSVSVAESQQILRHHFNDFTGALVVGTSREGELWVSLFTGCIIDVFHIASFYRLRLN